MELGLESRLSWAQGLCWALCCLPCPALPKAHHKGATARWRRQRWTALLLQAAEQDGVKEWVTGNVHMPTGTTLLDRCPMTAHMTSYHRHHFTDTHFPLITLLEMGFPTTQGGHFILPPKTWTWFCHCPVDSLRSLASQSVVHGPAASLSPESLLETQNLRFHPRPSESKSAF